MSAYSFRIHSLFMRTCIEIEANFKVILAENNCSRSGRQLNMVDYRRVDATHHLSSYEVMLPIWSGFAADLATFRTVATSTWTSESPRKGPPNFLAPRLQHQQAW
ncbi:hypothetical protein ACVWXM_009780 [Bradyrhizobium sp. GM7.3]